MTRHDGSKHGEVTRRRSLAVPFHAETMVGSISSRAWLCCQAAVTTASASTAHQVQAPVCDSFSVSCLRLLISRLAI